jgi:hypothetical protein
MCARAGQATDENLMRRIRIACWINKATKTQSEYVILIVFARHQWLNEHASVLRYTYIACLIMTHNEVAS